MTPLRVGSVCSGIAAPETAWRGLPFEPLWFAEIDPFPSAVLAHRYPQVPNHGDFTALLRPENRPADVDVLVGGTPCQAFSVAGLRGGLTDPRGQLTEAFFKLASIMRPKFVLWENVPGVLSIDKGKVFSDILAYIEEIGYVADVDILDAQFFGLAQRRRRVFILCQSIESIRERKTSSSGLMLAQCLTETLALALAAARGPSPTGAESSVFGSGEPVRLLQRRIKLFEMERDDLRATWQQSLDAIRPVSACAPAASGSLIGGEPASMRTPPVVTRWSESYPGQVGESPNIGPSWSTLLADLWPMLSAFTTSTSTSATTESTICTFAKASLLTAARIGHSMDSSPGFWSAASSASTAMREYTNYARRAVSSLFTGARWTAEWDHFLREAKRLHQSLGGAGDWACAPPLLSLRQGMFGDLAPRRRSRAGVAGSLGTGASDGGGWRGGTDEAAAGHVVAGARAPDGGGVDLESPEDVPSSAHRDVAHTLKAKHNSDHREDGETYVAFNLRGRKGGAQAEVDPTGMANLRSASGGSSRTMVAYQCHGSNVGEMGTLRSGNQGVTGGVPFVAVGLTEDRDTARSLNAHPTGMDLDTETFIAHTLRAEGHDASEDGTGRGVPLVPVAMAVQEDKQNGVTVRDTAGSLRSDAPGSQVGGSLALVAFSSKDYGADAGEISPTIRAGGHVGSHANGGAGPAIASPIYGVRRLTPTEMERLQGFPDGWTLVPYRNGMASDGPRAKALGNSMAVPVLRWLGERILKVDTLR